MIMSENNDLNYQVISDHADFLALREDWEWLFDENPLHSPFLAWGWVAAWLQHLAGPHRLRIVVLRDASSELQMIIPMLERNSLIVNACGYGPECSDHVGFLRLSKHENRLTELASQALSECMHAGKTMQLASLESAHLNPSDLAEKLRAVGRRVRLVNQNVCPTVDLPDSWEELSATLSRNFRSQVNRKYRQVAEHDNVEFHSTDVADAAEFTAQLIRLNRARMDDAGKESSLENGHFREFLTDAVPYMASAGIAWMDSIKMDGQTIGSALNFTHGNRIYFYMGGFDQKATKLAPGNTLFKHVISRAIENGYSKYDFLRGAEPYKYRWGASDVPIQTIEAYPDTFFTGPLMWAIDAGKRTLRHVRRATHRRSGSDN